VNSALRYSPGSLVFGHVFECGMIAYNLTSCLNSPECSVKSDDENEGYLSVGVRGENTRSYSDGNELHHAQESATKGSKDPATSCRCNDKEAHLLRHLGIPFLYRIKGVVGQGG
jgi:hypothetical protein